MKKGFYWGMAGAIANVLSYLISGLMPELLGFGMVAKFGLPGRVFLHFLSIVSCVGFLVFFVSLLMGNDRLPRKPSGQNIGENGTLSRAGFWAIAKWLYALELLVAFPLALSIFIWHGSFVVYSFWANTPGWCLAMSAFGLTLIILIRIVMLGRIIRRFHDCALPTWLAVMLFVVSFAPHVWWVASALMILIAGFVKGSAGRNRYEGEVKGENGGAGVWYAEQNSAELNE